MLYTIASLALLASSALAAETGDVGTIKTLDGGLGGTVHVVNDSALMISDYTLKDASAPALYWWGSKDSKLSGGFRINNERVDKPASTNSIVIALDAGHKPADFEYVGLWCEKLSANFGQAMLSKDGNSSDSGSGTNSDAKKGAATGLTAIQPATLFALLGAVTFAAHLV